MLFRLRKTRIAAGRVVSVVACFLIRAADAEPEAPLPNTILTPLPLVPAYPADNPPTPAKAKLGRLLFFDPVLSAAGEVACATCHHPAYAWTDARPAPVGVMGVGLGPQRRLKDNGGLKPLERNVPSLLDVAYNGITPEGKMSPLEAPMFWDSRVQSLEGQALVPLRSREEMRGDLCREDKAVEQAVQRVAGIVEYRQLFADAFLIPKESAVSAKHLAQAIASFERTLISPNTAYDRFLRGDASAMTPLQQQGLKVFREAGCVFCHNGPMLSDYKLHFIGVTDSRSRGRRELRTPTLRHLPRTGPYMHDGSQRSLHEVLAFYEELSDAASESLDGGDDSVQPKLDPLLKKLNLNAEDFPAMEAFLQALDSDDYDRSVPDHVPSGLGMPKMEEGRK